MMNQTSKNFSNDAAASISSAWSALNCSIIIACSYSQTLKPLPPPEFVNPTQCNNQQPVGRKKREVTGPGGGGGGGPPNNPPPPVAADFNTSAVFLQQYMDLNLEDKIAIGHRCQTFDKNFPPKI